MEGATYAEMYDEEDVHWWFRGRRALIWALLGHAHLREKSRVLDAGCGTGRNMIEFGSLGPTSGIDASSEAVGFCHRRGLEAVQTAGLEALPFEDAQFDVLLACDVLEHVAADGRALGELHRVADAQAHLIITVPAYQWLWTDHDVQLHHVRRYTLRDLRSRVRSSGWVDVRSTYFNTLLLPAIAATRIASRLRSRSRPGHTDLERTPRVLNGVLVAPLRLEAAAVRRGVRLPAGASVGMLCRKAS